MARSPAPCGTESAYKRHKRKGEAVDAACMEAMRAAARARSGRADDEAQSAPVVPLRGGFKASKSRNVDAQERLIANMELVERAMEAIADADPLKIVQLSKRHSELVAELVAIDGSAPAEAGEDDPFAGFLAAGAAGRPAAAPRKSS